MKMSSRNAHCRTSRTNVDRLHRTFTLNCQATSTETPTCTYTNAIFSTYTPGSPGFQGRSPSLSKIASSNSVVDADEDSARSKGCHYTCWYFNDSHEYRRVDYRIKIRVRIFFVLFNDHSTSDISGYQHHKVCRFQKLLRLGSGSQGKRVT